MGIETLARESVHNQKSTAMWRSRTKKSIAVGVVAVVLAITVQFLVNYFTNELSKESHVDKQGAMVSTAGKVVKTQMEEMKVNADGKLLSRNGDAAVKTLPSLAKVALASSLPDATLLALDEITVHSDKGYTLQIKVHGFSRVPVLNSRCGNVVHFYTAWKGKVTLDSTDLSFDEATAAEFKNAGFSLATGGRRLAGKITVDGFGKALDGMRESGKWTCADVPLPTFSQSGHRELTSYTTCRTSENDKDDAMCFSAYGGLKYGVVALHEGLALAKTSNQLYTKSSSVQMNSDSYSVSILEYAMHPGQQLVMVSDKQTSEAIQFQLLESDKSRSHCRRTENDPAVKLTQDAKNNKIDSDWHFEYMGINEEDGRVLRHFRLMLSPEYASSLYGEASTSSLTHTAHFWDVAETMQPNRLQIGDSLVAIFDSYKHTLSDDEVIEAVKARTNKTIVQLKSCSDAEQTDRFRPGVGIMDLNRDDAAYYEASSVPKSAALAKYLDAVKDSYALPDTCYHACSSQIEAVKQHTNGDICQSNVLDDALRCLREGGINECLTSNFVQDNENDCSRNTKNTSEQRKLEEAEDADVEPHFLLSNATGVPHIGESRRLVTISAFTCKSEGGIPYCGGPWWNPICCVAWGDSRSIQKLFKSPVVFSLTFTWGLVGGYMGLSVDLSACVDLMFKVFKIPNCPLKLTACLSGNVSVSSRRTCPQVALTMSGWASFSMDLYMDFWVCTISFAKLTLYFAANMQWYADHCWWVLAPWNDCRRRWWRRRRNHLRCNYNACDIVLSGYVGFTRLTFEARCEFKYWVKRRVIEIFVKLLAWTPGKTYTAFEMCVYRRGL